jgi:A/G-specific adenine glycosylase
VTSTPPAGDASAIGEAIVDWYATAARDLPWRRPGTDAWAVLVSEVMLQQTPVARVEPVWREWLDRWPTPADLAAATPADVIRAWGKLGYPRRALRLREAAAAIVDRHAGVVPDDVPALEALPGIGTYTARAVACFGYGQPQPVELTPAEPARATRFSVAAMELGALVCVARSPRCGACPVRNRCAWRLAGSPAHDGPARRVQKFTGTDRQVRGRLLDVLRAAHEPVDAAALEPAWDDVVQRSRCLDSLLTDGLVEQTPDGLFTLPT